MPTPRQVLEFVLFKERLERAHSYALARAEKAILTLRQQLAAPASSSTGGGAGSSSSGGGAAAGTAGAAQSAPGAAARALPLEELAGPTWSAMRFNADLQTRAPWLPPPACAAHTALMHWWEGRAGGEGADGETGAWWRCVGAAEADVEPARRLRRAQHDGAVQRWLLPHLLAATLACDQQLPGGPGRGSSSGGGAAAPAAAAVEPAAGASLADLVPRFAAALGVSPADGAGIDAALSAAFGGGGDAAPPSRQLQLLDLALFHTAAAVEQLLAALQPPVQSGGGGAADQGAAADLDAAAAAVARRAGALASALAALERRVSQQLAPAASSCGLASGGALSFAALLADEGCLWAVACLEGWARAVKALRRKASKKAASAAAAAAAAPLSAPPTTAALEGLSAATAAAGRLLAALAASAKQAAAQPAEAGEQELLRLLDPDSSPLMRPLAGWEPRLSVHHVVKALQTEQRGALQRVAAAAGALQQRAAAVGW
jgi:hypothetical protein